MSTKRVLISGAGIAGPTLAYWLARYGFDVTIVEKAPALRTGGYVIDFWGAGFDIAERMDILPEIRSKGYVVQEVRVVNRDGRRVAGFPAAVFGRITHGRYVSLARGDLAAAIFGIVRNDVEAIFGDSIARIDQKPAGVGVEFEHAGQRDFDLVIGADGLHSEVRRLVFGPEERYEKYLGYKVAAFETAGYRPRNELVYLMYTEVDQQVARFSMNDDRTLFLFTFADPAAEGPTGMEQQKELLRRRFGRSGWECLKVLEALDACSELYFDRVSQIRMNAQEGLWSKGRVTLLGDAAFCVSLLAGQGSALAMVAAYVLAGELYRANGDYAKAFQRYQDLFGPFVSRKQEAALRFAGSFAPRSKASMFLRNRIFDLLKIGWIADLAAGRDLVDRIALPNYPDARPAAPADS
jgi:2-polyprenyl-6-methoxyphenol hydroxylase-like FAD-dependent oxidoreductase